jgi:hypothetical protein
MDGRRRHRRPWSGRSELPGYGSGVPCPRSGAWGPSWRGGRWSAWRSSRRLLRSLGRGSGALARIWHAPPLPGSHLVADGRSDCLCHCVGGGRGPTAAGSLMRLRAGRALTAIPRRRCIGATQARRRCGRRLRAPIPCTETSPRAPQDGGYVAWARPAC